MTAHRLLGSLVVLLALSGIAAAQVVPVPAGTPPIAEIRVHGNHSTPDAEVIAASGLAVGLSADDEALRAAAERLRASGRFQSATLQRRGRSIDDPADIMVVILIEELPGTSPDLPAPGWLKRTTAGVMWLPVLSYTEGYGVTFGLRIAVEDVLGPKSRISAPLTWGGERKAGLTLERSFERGPLTRVLGGFSIRQSEHPAFDLDERRVGGDARAERALTSWLRIGALGRLEDVRFDGTTSRVGIYGGDVTVDTRLDPAFPRNAVWVAAGVEGVDVESVTRARYRLDANGALGLFRGSALSARVFQVSADGPLPPFEQAWIGGASSLRGFPAGARVDDNAAGASATLAYPLGSPLNWARIGVRAFVDWAAVYPAGTSWQDASYDRGAGGGVFANVAAFTLSLDVARSDDGHTRVHFRMGTRF